jgi:hypothetical protein
MNQPFASLRYMPPPPSPAKIYLGSIPKGYLGTRKTLEHIQRLIREGAKDFYVRQKAIDILLARGIRPKDYLGEVKALFEWVQRNVRYTKDPLSVETLHSARRMLELRAGDCDDMTILLGAMLEAIGHPIRLVIVGPDPRRPRFFSHIYQEVNYKGRWIPLDPTVPHAMGWAPPSWVKKVVPMERKRLDLTNVEGLQEVGAAIQTAGWLSSLIRDMGGRAIPPRDSRVKRLEELLRQRDLAGRSRWLEKLLARIWERGLAARRRPRTALCLVRVLRRLGLIEQSSASHSKAARPVRGAAMRIRARARGKSG